MTDLRRLLVAGALVASLTLAGCADTTEPDPPSKPTASDTKSPTTAEPSAMACDALDVSALTAETGIELDVPSIGGKPGEREACSISFGTGSVLRIDLLPKRDSLEQDVQKVMLLGTEKPEAVTVAGQPALLVAVSDRQLIAIGLVTHTGERVLQVRVNSPDVGDDLLRQLRTLVLSAAEQVAAGVL